MLAIKAMTAMKLTRDDNVPAEIIPGLYLGSVGVAFNKEALQKNQITHILTCADKIQPRFLSVRDSCYSLIACRNILTCACPSSTLHLKI